VRDALRWKQCFNEATTARSWKFPAILTHQRAAAGLCSRGQRFAFQMLQHHEVDAVLFAHVEKDADTRMLQAGGGCPSSTLG
jgi:hypothetical protein